jgi:hypothetical protein
MNILPTARTSQITFNELGMELQIHDISVNKAFCLNKTSAIIYMACNGSMTFAEMNLKYSLTDDLIYLALEELNAANLLANGNDFISPFVAVKNVWDTKITESEAVGY